MMLRLFNDLRLAWTWALIVGMRASWLASPITGREKTARFSLRLLQLAPYDRRWAELLVSFGDILGCLGLSGEAGRVYEYAANLRERHDRVQRKYVAA